MQRIKPAVNRNGNGQRLVDSIRVSRFKELRAFVVYTNWHPRAIGVRMHWNKRGRKRAPSDDTFDPILVPLDRATDLVALLSRAYTLALNSQREEDP